MIFAVSTAIFRDVKRRGDAGDKRNMVARFCSSKIAYRKFIFGTCVRYAAGNTFVKSSQTFVIFFRINITDIAERRRQIFSLRSFWIGNISSRNATQSSVIGECS